jgi:hypothetical protein
MARYDRMAELEHGETEPQLQQVTRAEIIPSGMPSYARLTGEKFEKVSASQIEA